MKRNKLITTLFLAGAITISSFTSVFASTNEVVTLGANLNAEQKEEMFNEFGVKPDDVKVITMNIQEIRSQLGLPPAPANAKGNAFSSAFVRIEEPGYGIKVKTNNLTAVTPDMLSNALLTSGVTDADVVATSPFPVTGTSALAGVLQAFEDATGKEIPTKNKEVARDELTTTNNLADAKNEDGKEIGQNGASAIVNQAKKEVIKEKPENEKQVGQIVNNVVNNYNVNLTPEQQAQLTTLMSKINSLDLNYSSLKDQLNSMTDKIQQTLEQSGEQLKESGIIEKTLNKILDVCTQIKNWFVTHFGDGKVTINGVTFDKDGHMVNTPSNDADNTEANDKVGLDEQSNTEKNNTTESQNSNDNTAVNNTQESTQKNDNTSGSENNSSKKQVQNDNNLGDKSDTGSQSKSNDTNKDKNKETITLQDGKVVPKYNEKGEPYNPVTGGYGHIKETEDAGKAVDEVNNTSSNKNDYIIVDGKKVPLHNAQGVEYNPETGRYGDVK